MSTRTRGLVSACLNSSDNNDENKAFYGNWLNDSIIAFYSQKSVEFNFVYCVSLIIDVIAKSPQASPIKKQKKGMLVRRKHREYF